MLLSQLLAHFLAKNLRNYFSNTIQENLQVSPSQYRDRLIDKYFHVLKPTYGHIHEIHSRMVCYQSTADDIP